MLEKSHSICWVYISWLHTHFQSSDTCGSLDLVLGIAQHILYLIVSDLYLIIIINNTYKYKSLCRTSILMACPVKCTYLI